ncbi:MAG: hypothetical protein J0L92_03385 [Deltaproteobacteria bacterium]|nr:hypothetical protein [Deltaproteobacteria bacterium]
MSHDRGVTCSACGASTPLPDDLRVATFTCAFCRATLETARYAGKQAVTADVLTAHLEGVVANPQQAMQDMKDGVRAPVFEDENQATRAAACTRCGGRLAVPLNLRIHQVTCGACGATHPVAQYVSDAERLALDMERQQRGNEALRNLAQSGVACTKCGGRNEVPTDGTVQIVCRFCSQTILLSDHVDAGAIARARLKNAVFGMKDELRAREERSQRNWRIGIAVFVVLALGTLAIANVMGLIPH